MPVVVECVDEDEDDEEDEEVRRCLVGASIPPEEGLREGALDMV